MNDWPTRHEQERTEWLSEDSCSATDLESSLLRDIELLRQHHGALHPELIERRNCLAGLHELAGRTDQALALYREHLDDLLELLGPDAPATRQTQALYDALLERASRSAPKADPTQAMPTGPADWVTTGLLLVPCPPRHADLRNAVQRRVQQLRSRSSSLIILDDAECDFTAALRQWLQGLARDPDVLVLPWLTAPDLNVADPDPAGTALVARLLAESRRRLVLIGVEARDLQEAEEILIDWHEPARQAAARRLIERTRIDAPAAPL